MHSSIFSSSPLRTSKLVSKIIIWSLLLAILYIVLIQLWQPAVNKTISQWGDNQLRAERYIYNDEVPKAVFVGSSLMARIPDDSDDVFYNLAFGGRSAITGLKILNHCEKLPELVVIESNVVAAEIDEAFVDRLFSSPMFWIRKYVYAFRFEYQPINLFLTAIKGRYGMSEARKLAENANAEIVKKMISRRLVDLSSSQMLQDVNENILILNNEVKKLHNKGVRIVFIDMPVERELMNNPVYSRSRNRISSVFPDISWVKINETESYETTDGIHLIYRDAIKVREKIRSYYQEISSISL